MGATGQIDPSGACTGGDEGVLPGGGEHRLRGEDDRGRGSHRLPLGPPWHVHRLQHGLHDGRVEPGPIPLTGGFQIRRPRPGQRARPEDIGGLGPGGEGDRPGAEELPHRGCFVRVPAVHIGFQQHQTGHPLRVGGGGEYRGVRSHGLAHQHHRLTGCHHIGHRDDVADEGLSPGVGRHPGAVPVSALVHQHAPVLGPQRPGRGHELPGAAGQPVQEHHHRGRTAGVQETDPHPGPLHRRARKFHSFDSPQ